MCMSLHIQMYFHLWMKIYDFLNLFPNRKGKKWVDIDKTRLAMSQKCWSWVNGNSLNCLIYICIGLNSLESIFLKKNI